MYLIYKVQATNPDPVETVDFYYFVQFQNIMVLADGTCALVT